MPELRDALEELLRAELNLRGPLPEGPLDEHFDSMQRLALVVAIEDRFEISFDPEDEDEVRTLADVEALVKRKLEVVRG